MTTHSGSRFRSAQFFLAGRSTVPMLALIVLTTACSPAGAVDCLDTDAALEYWRPIKAQATDATTALDSLPINLLPINSLAIELVPCLGSPHPELRDQIGYELFTRWLRNDQLATATLHQLYTELSARLSTTDGEHALARSFSALILAELMRADAQKAFLTDDQRQTLLEEAIAALGAEKDFRGLDENLGWVHPVAHLGDLLWRFALHPQATTNQAASILAGVSGKVSPTGTSYRFNESDRLARVASTLIQRELLDSAHFVTWLEAFSTPTSMPKWSDAFRSVDGMAELHNTKQFLRALSDQLDGADVQPEITQTLQLLVQGFTQLI